MIPVTISCCHAFMLPVGAPSNAMVLSAGKIRQSEMVILLQSNLTVSSINKDIISLTYLDESWGSVEYHGHISFMCSYGDHWQRSVSS